MVNLLSLLNISKPKIFSSSVPRIHCLAIVSIAELQRSSCGFEPFWTLIISWNMEGCPSPYLRGYPASRGPSIFLDESGGRRDLSRKIEGPMLAGYPEAGSTRSILFFCQRHDTKHLKDLTIDPLTFFSSLDDSHLAKISLKVTRLKRAKIAFQSREILQTF